MTHRTILCDDDVIAEQATVRAEGAHMAGMMQRSPPNPRDSLVLKRLTAPFRNFFNARFVALSNSVQVVQADLDAIREDLALTRRSLDELSSAGTRTITANLRQALDEQHSDLMGVTGLLGRSVDQAVDGLTVLLERTDPAFAARADHVVAQLMEGVLRTTEDRFDEAVHGSVARLDHPHVDVANYADSHRGWASQAGLWFNPPISVEHLRGGVRVADINERIAEVPFVYAALAELPVGSRIIDVGSTESPVALSLASLGHRVTALDPRPYPLEHANLEVHIGPLETYQTDDTFDAAVLLSSIEHFGLGAYNLPEDAEADIKALARLRELLKPGGTLVLTTPYGDAPTTKLQRTYSPDQLDALLAGWEVRERSYLTRVTSTEWRRVERLDDYSGSHVVLVRAVRPQG